MRWAKSYSIVDHQVFHGGYFQILSHKALVLYLFLVIVGDRHGRSYYAERTIMEILHLNKVDFAHARKELIETSLINFTHPYFWVKNLDCSVGCGKERKPSSLSQRHLSAYPSPGREGDKDFEKMRRQILLRQLAEMSV